jgi:hypothetical protein
MNNAFTTIYSALADRIADKVAPGWIDLDQGQLLDDRGEYPLPFHLGVVLLDFDEVAWHDIGQGIQRGDAQVRVTLAMQVVADSHQASTQHQQALLKLEKLGQLHQALQHFEVPGQGALVRTYSRKEEPTLQGVWVYSMGYKLLATDAGGYDGHTQTVSGLESQPQIAFVLP